MIGARCLWNHLRKVTSTKVFLSIVERGDTHCEVMVGCCQRPGVPGRNVICIVNISGTLTEAELNLKLGVKHVFLKRKPCGTRENRCWLLLTTYFIISFQNIQNITLRLFMNISDS